MKLYFMHFCNFFMDKMRISWCNFRRIPNLTNDFEPFSADFWEKCGLNQDSKTSYREFSNVAQVGRTKISRNLRKNHTDYYAKYQL